MKGETMATLNPTKEEITGGCTALLIPDVDKEKPKLVSINPTANPYFEAGDLIRELIWPDTPSTSRVWTEMVHTPTIMEGEDDTHEYHLKMFVDSDSVFKPDSYRLNVRASHFYHGQIMGPAVLMLMELVHDEEGPDWEVRDMPETFWSVLPDVAQTSLLTLISVHGPHPVLSY